MSTPRDTTGSRSKLITAAGILFSTSGYGQVNVRAIATKAQVNVALIHRHFGTKAGLFRAVVEHAFASSSWTPKQDDWKGLAARVLDKRHASDAQLDLTRMLLRSQPCEEIREDITWALQHIESTLWPLWPDPMRARARAGVILSILLGVETSQNILRQRLWLGMSEADKVVALTDILRAAS